MVAVNTISYELQLVNLFKVPVLSQFQVFIIKTLLRCNRVILNWDTSNIDVHFCSFLLVFMGEQDALVGFKPFA